MRIRGTTAPLAIVLAIAVAPPARAQSLPSEPIVLAGDRVTIGGDVSATFGCAHTSDAFCGEDTGFFNYTDYEHSALRRLRVDVTTAVKAGRHLSVLSDIRAESGVGIRAYGLYARVRPWADRSFDIQAGRVPPTFGAFARRTYASDNLLIGYPLGYQYLTSLRTDAVPIDADELLRMRGRGWLSSFSLGNPLPGHGVPVASAFAWDTGVQVHAGNEIKLLEATGAVTVGTLANPLFHDDNDGRQIAGRLVARPTAGLVLGASLARGAFLARPVARVADAADTDRFTQTAWGFDVEYSRDYYLARVETIVSDWQLPTFRAPVIQLPLRAVSTSIEGRYKIRPGLYAAARFDHLGFSEIQGRLTRQSWDAPVSRIEVGGGYSLQRNLILKLAFQHNTRDGGRVTALDVSAIQLLYWF